MLQCILLITLSVIAIQARPPTHYKCINKPLCMNYCKYGNHVARDGCDICKCKQPPHCPKLVCTYYCEHGFQLAANECETCKCKLPPHCSQVKCEAICYHGFKVGADGCEICQCKNSSLLE